MVGEMILAIDVTSQVPGFAWSDGVQLGYAHLHSKKPSAHLFPPLDAVLKSNRIQRLGVVTGPGSFTGIRSGIATALGLKASLGIPVVGMNKFEIMLFELGELSAKELHLIVPARGKRVYYAHWKSGQWITQPMECNLEELSPGMTYYSSGESLGKTFVQPLRIHFPKTCLRALQAGKGSESLEPLYIRPADTRQNLTYIEKLLAQD